MSKKSEIKQIVPEALERHFRGLIDQAVLWLGAEAVIAHAEIAQAEMAKREDEAA